MGDVHHCSGPTVSEMTYTVSSGTLNSSIPYYTNLPLLGFSCSSAILISLHFNGHFPGWPIPECLHSRFCWS